MICEGSTESGLMEKPGIEPATPGLQLRHRFTPYTTAMLRHIGMYIITVDNSR